MGKKKINIVLIAIVLSLWGTVLYKYVKHFFQDQPKTEVMTKATLAVLPSTIKKDTFLLSQLTADPFLKKAIAQTEIATNNTPKVFVPKIRKVKTIAPVIHCFKERCATYFLLKIT